MAKRQRIGVGKVPGYMSRRTTSGTREELADGMYVPDYDIYTMYPRVEFGETYRRRLETFLPSENLTAPPVPRYVGGRPIGSTVHRPRSVGQANDRSRSLMSTPAQQLFRMEDPEQVVLSSDPTMTEAQMRQAMGNPSTNPVLPAESEDVQLLTGAMGNLSLN